MPAACRELDISDIFRHQNVADVEFTTPGCVGDDLAAKELDRLDGPNRARVLCRVAALEDDPRPLGAARLVVIVVRVAGRGKVYRDV